MLNTTFLVNYVIEYIGDSIVVAVFVCVNKLFLKGTFISFWFEILGN